MNKNQISPFFLFSLIFLASFIGPVFSADSYGNQINNFDAYEKVLGVYSYPIINVTNDTYTALYQANTTSDTFRFQAITQLNESLATYPESFNTIAAGIQILGDNTNVAGPMFATPYTNDGNFWYHIQLSEWDLQTNDTDVITNMTLWLDVERNGTWVLIEEWTFNMTGPVATTYTPDAYNGLDLTFVWFWCCVGSLFVTAISSGLAMKKVSAKYLLIAIFAAMFSYSFYLIMANGG